MAKSPYSPTGQKSGFQSIGASSLFGPAPKFNTSSQFQQQSFDTKLAHGTDITEQFKGLPNTGFTPGANPNVGGGLLFQQRLRLMYVQLVESGMSAKDAAVHIQKTTGFHARTGQKIVAKVEHTKQGKIKYAGLYSTKKHYRGLSGRSGHHRPRKYTASGGIPAGLK